MRISSNVIYWAVVAYFFGASGYFTYRVQNLKNKLESTPAPVEFPSGEKVKVTKIISGHELIVEYKGLPATVRMLGIMSYPSNVNDPLMENIAKNSWRYLEENVLNKDIKILFDKFQKDSYNRILGFVYSDSRDIGLELVANGYSVVYTRYAFPREATYLKAEFEAQKNKKGIWGVPAAAARSRQLKILWENEKAQEGNK